MELLKEIFLYSLESNQIKPDALAGVCRQWSSIVTSMSINAWLPTELLREIFLYSLESNQTKPDALAAVCRHWRSVVTSMTINAYLPMELLREIFLYSLASNEIKSGELAAVCRHWRSVVTSITNLWSTLRVGTWTEMERVATWLQRAYPKKVIIDTQRDLESPPENPAFAFAALEKAFTSTGQWQELTLSSFPPENEASQLGVQVASPMSALEVLHVAAGCVDSPSFSHLLNLVPTEAPLTELRLHPSFASTTFLQPHWFSVLQNLTVLIVNGRDIDGPFGLLPTFTRLRIFEADRLHLPFYGPNTNLPLLSTLWKLHLRACSIQWMAGRYFPRLEECAILLPRHWATIQQHEVQFPSCKKLTYYGHPMTAAQYFRVPNMSAMELRSHDCKERRVYRHLRHLCRVDGRISGLTTLHLTFQCSEQVFIKILRYLVPLQELVLSIAHPSPSWQTFLESLAAKPSTNDWPVWDRLMVNDPEWVKWYSSQTWNANVLPHLKYLGIQCPKGFSQSECLETCPILRLVGWTRARLTPPLEHLKVWEGRGTTVDIVVDYIATGYLDKHLGIQNKEYDEIVVRGMVAQCLLLVSDATRLFKLHSTVLFRLLEDLKLSFVRHENFPNHDFEILLPCLKQIKRLRIVDSNILADPLKSHAPLMDTLQWLALHYSAFCWMLGRSFNALKEFVVVETRSEFKDLSRHEGLRVDLPVCTILKLDNFSDDHLRFLSCPNVQIFRFVVSRGISKAALKHLTDFLYDCSSLQRLEIHIHEELGGVDALMQFVFGDVRDQGVWRDIRSVEVTVGVIGSSRNNENRPFASMVGHQQHYEKWWREFTVTEEVLGGWVTVRASR